VHLDHAASIIVNASQDITSPAEILRASDCTADIVSFGMLGN
jgi:hypothetical protein